MIRDAGNRMQVGVRFEADTWTRYKRLCQVQGKWPNELLEVVMARAVSSGSVQECIDGLSVESESEQLVTAVVVRKLLLEIDELVDQGYWMIFRNEEAGDLLPDEQEKQAPYPELAPAIEKTIEQLLPRLTSVHDKALLARAKHSLERAQAYIRDLEKPTNADYDYAKDEFVESSFTQKRREEHRNIETRPHDPEQAPFSKSVSE
jgi:hypothetical protein